MNPRAGDSAVVAWLRSYCLATGQHGYRYLADSGLHFSERVVWLSVIIASTVVSAYIISITWNGYDSKPTLTVIEDNHYNIWNMPFPAVTICGINQLNKNMIVKFIDKLKLPIGVSREDIMGDMHLVTAFFDMNAEIEYERNYTRLQTLFDDNNYTINQVMRELSPSCASMIKRCMWKGRPIINCLETFKDIRTYEGYCCTFNYVAYTQELMESMKMDIGPKRLSACGKTIGLTIILNNELDDYYDTMFASHGFKVMIHNELDYPDESASQMVVPLGSQMFVALSPSEVYATPAVEALPVERRQCRFSGEKRVDSMGAYTYNNCAMFCRKQLSLRLCNCYAFYYPGPVSLDVCNLTDIFCLTKERKRLSAMSETDDDPERDAAMEDARAAPNPCGCLPECVHTRYRVQRSHIPLEPDLLSDLTPTFYSDLHPRNNTVLHVFYEDLIGTRFRLSTRAGWVELLASVGGILSLLLGFSFLCLFEFVYFFTLRVFGELLVRHSGAARVKQGSASGAGWRDGAPGSASQRPPPPALSPWAPIHTGIARDFLRPPAGHAALLAPPAGGERSPPRRRRRF